MNNLNPTIFFFFIQAITQTHPFTDLYYSFPVSLPGAWEVLYMPQKGEKAKQVATFPTPTKLFHL